MDLAAQAGECRLAQDRGLIRGGDEEDVVHLGADRGDLGVLQPDPADLEDLAHLGQQAGAVQGVEPHHGAAVGLIDREADPGLDREVVVAARQAAGDRDAAAGMGAQAGREGGVDLVHPLRVVDRLPIQVQHLVGVDGHVVVAGHDAGVLDAETQLVQEGRGAGKQVGAVAGVDEDLGAAAGGDRADHDQGLIVRDLAEDQARLPGDLVRRVGQEEVLVESAPQALTGNGVGAIALDQPLRLGLFLLDQFVLTLGVIEAAEQGATGGVVEVAQQGVEPTVPAVRVGGARIRHREQVEIVQAGWLPDDLGEGLDHLGIADVLALGGHGHQQVPLHQPGDQAAVELREFVQAAEVPGVPRPQQGVIAAAPLGDVVEEPRQVEDLDLGDAQHDCTAQGEFLCVLGEGEAAQVAHQDQGVLVDRVDVEEVVLHAPDDVREGREVGGQHPVLIHAPQGVGGTAGLAQALHEEGAGAQVGAEGVVDAVAVLTDRADGTGAYPLQFRVSLENLEGLQQGDGVALEDVGFADLQKAAAALKAPVERDRRADIVMQQNGLVEQLQQHLVQTVEFLDRAVVLLHELLDRQVALAVAVTERGGQGALIVEQQAVLPAPGEAMEREADTP